MLKEATIELLKSSRVERDSYLRLLHYLKAKPIFCLKGPKSLLVIEQKTKISLRHRVGFYVKIGWVKGTKKQETWSQEPPILYPFRYK